MSRRDELKRRKRELARQKNDPLEPDPHPEEEIKLALDAIDVPIEDRDAIERAEDMESEAMRAERDADFEVVDDVPDQVFDGFSDVDDIDIGGF